MLRINMNAVDIWSTQQKIWALISLCCLVFGIGCLALIAGPHYQLKHTRQKYAQTQTQLQAQEALLQRKYAHLEKTQRHNIPATVRDDNKSAPFSAMHTCAVTEYQWQHHRSFAEGQGRPYYSLIANLRYEQVICLLTKLAKFENPHYLQKMTLSHQDKQSSIRVDMVYNS